jgi:hypothetical protein
MDTAFMGLTSCRLITITGKLSAGDAVRNRHHAGCRVAIERAADRYTPSSVMGPLS